ncbi:MAG: sel1 repeat family protein [Synergistaceae bacterium]|nr:sel1 repeat family protein [Synergistaceae bacterium]
MIHWKYTETGRYRRLKAGVLMCVLAVFFTQEILTSAAFAASAETSRQENPSGTPEQAFAKIKTDAERGDTQALLTLGGLYAEGVGVSKNFSKARECYEKAAEAGMAEGIFNVGVCWEIGMGSEADPRRAAEYFRRAADMKLPQALFKMAVILDAGAGIERNEKASLRYMAQAAAAGHPDAASIMGVLWLNGLRGEKKNPKEGLKMLNVAASKGNVEAMKNIAVVYKDGIGVKASPADALKWYIIAEKCGYPTEALSGVTAEIRKKLSSDQRKKAESEANAWLKKARASASRS